MRDKNQKNRGPGTRAADRGAWPCTSTDTDFFRVPGGEIMKRNKDARTNQPLMDANNGCATGVDKDHDREYEFCFCGFSPAAQKNGWRYGKENLKRKY